MRIVEIVPSLEERQGGPSKSVRRLSAALADLHHEVRLLSTEEGAGASLAEGRLEIETFHRGWPQRICPSKPLRRRLDQLDPEIIHHHSLWLRTLHYAHRRAKGAGVPLVISPRGMMAPWTWAHRPGRKRLARLLIHPGALEGAAGWHATSDKEAADIRSCGYQQPICIAPNSIDPPNPAATEAAKRFWTELCPETAERRTALFYSRFHRKKRVLELIDAWIESAPRDWLLLLVGIPQEYSTKMLNDYVEHASGAGRIRIFSGMERPPPYAVASLFLLPSHDENFGLVIGEALAHGLPAVVTDTTPWQALNDHGGWCVPWKDFGRTLDAATTETSDRLRNRGEQAQSWALQEYSWEKPARTLAEFYQGLKSASL